MPHEAIPLSKRGRQQAEALVDALPATPAAVLVSGMVRTHQTAAPYCAHVALAPRQHAGLNEFSLIDADLIAGMDGPQRRLFVRDYWDNPDPHRRWGLTADTFVEFEARVRSFIDEMDHVADSTVIFGHGIWLGMLHWLLLGNQVRDANDMHAFRRFQLALPMPNCAVFTAARDMGQWHMQTDVGLLEASVGRFLQWQENDWKELDRRIAAEGLDDDCLLIAKSSEKPGESLTKEILEQTFTPSEHGGEK